MLLQNRRLFRKLLLKRTFVGIFSTILNLIGLYCVLSISYTPDLSKDWGMTFGWKPWMGEEWWIILLMVLWVLFGTLASSSGLVNSKQVRQLYPKKEDGAPVGSKQLTAHLGEDEIVSMTLSIAEKMKVEVSGIFGGQNPVPNAFTTFAVEHGNIVFLNSNLFDIMDKESVESVIAHELGHIKGQDIWYKIGNNIPMQVIRLWIFLMMLQLVGIMLLSPTIWIFGKRLILVLVSLACFGIFSSFLERYAHWYSRMKEKIADAYAAEYTSVEAMMNGLLRLNDRSHTLSVFIDTLRKEDAEIDQEVLQMALHNFPTGIKEQDYIIENAKKYYLEAQLDVLLHRNSVQLQEQEKDDFLTLLLIRKEQQKKQAEKEKPSETEKPSEIPTEKPFIWQKFDWNHDGELQKNELVALIEALKKDPRALTDKEGHQGTHPSIRDRLLFIADLYKDVLEEGSDSV